MCAKAKPYLEMGDENGVKPLKGEAKEKYEALKAELAKFDIINPGELPEGIGMADLGRNAPATHILAVGDYDAPKEEVQPGFLTLLDPASGEDRAAAEGGIHRPPHGAGEVADRSRRIR